MFVKSVRGHLLQRVISLDTLSLNILLRETMHVGFVTKHLQD